MKNLNIPYIEGLEGLSFEELDKTMELSATKDFISTVNWSGFPYKPTVSFRIARSASHIVIIYNVRGLDLRAAALEDNGPVWEDSCCEFFVSHPSDGTYYNFELNCIGTLLASKRRSRNDADMFTAQELAQIRRFSTLENKAIEEAASHEDMIYSPLTNVVYPISDIRLSVNFWREEGFRAYGFVQ